MKKILIIIAIIIAIGVLMSLSYKDAKNKANYSPQITFIVPLKPNSTIIVDEGKVQIYLQKGYQVQNAWYAHNYGINKYVLVKY
jgi:hypothetical protein